MSEIPNIGKAGWAEQRLLVAASEGDATRVAALLAEGADPLVHGSHPLALAAGLGSEACVRLLLPVSDASSHDFEALREAAIHGHAGCVELLLPASDPLAQGSEALLAAAANGRARCVALLIPRSDPSAGEDDPLRMSALRAAAAGGHADCVDLLIPVSNPKALDSAALALACEMGHADCARLLAPHSDPMARKNAQGKISMLSAAASNGYAECVEILLQAGAANEDGFQALCWAARAGHAPCAALILPFCAQEDIHLALTQTARSGRPDCVPMLLPHCSERASQIALRIAARSTRAESFALIPMILPWVGGFDPIDGSGESCAAAARSVGFPAAALMIEAFFQAIHEQRELESSLSGSKRARSRASSL